MGRLRRVTLSRRWVFAIASLWLGMWPAIGYLSNRTPLYLDHPSQLWNRNGARVMVVDRVVVAELVSTWGKWAMNGDGSMVLRVETVMTNRNGPLPPLSEDDSARLLQNRGLVTAPLVTIPDPNRWNGGGFGHQAIFVGTRPKGFGMQIVYIEAPVWFVTYCPAAIIVSCVSISKWTKLRRLKKRGFPILRCTEPPNVVA
jgi:hypothetical protein